ncbi:MAG: VOC family protein [Curvibacter sp.]|nr:VOC family protein [Curvibacter sp.]
MSAALDHLVVAARTLEEGVAWCEASLGITPGPGGQHPLMGTHNRLFSIASTDFPLAYFEIIAVDPQAQAPARRRWFDLDDASLQARVRRDGPQLVHWVVRVDDARSAVALWQAQGLDPGEVITASRSTPGGLLQWQITVRPDGRRLFDGLLPTLIQWGPVHPATAMPQAGAVLEKLALQHPQAAELAEALRGIGLRLRVHNAPARLAARLRTPGGTVEICS